MRTLALAAGLIALTAASTLAKADVIVNFTIAGTGGGIFNPLPGTSPTYPGPGVASGTFTYDFTTDSVVTQDFTLTDGVFNVDLYPSMLVDNPSDLPCGLVDYRQSGSLTPTGGYFDIVQKFDEYEELGYEEYAIYDGTITPTVTPEPSTFALLGTGMLGVAGTLRKRFRSA